MSGGRPGVVVVGDALLDRDVIGDVERLCPDAPVPVLDERDRHTRPGGAGLAAALAAADGREVTLVTAIGPDDAGRELRAALAAAGVEVVDLGLDGSTPEKVRLRADGHSLLRLDRGSGGSIGPASASARAALEWASAVLVADYGRGVTSEPGVRGALARAAQHAPLVWDPHPHGAPPVPGAALATPNDAEARAFVPGLEGDGDASAGERARALAARWHAAAVCVTRGPRGAVLAAGAEPPVRVATEPVTGGDPCGAGDRFAASAAGALADGAPPAAAVAAAVEAATAFVAAGGSAAARLRARPASGGGPARGLAAGRGERSAFAVAESVRRRGGTVVATGGCFDLLHAGHVRTLEAARRLGDCLVVLLNSDASVSRLKGQGRPLVGEEDRAAVLLALGCVDAVLVFDEDTPAAALDRLRPEIWAKGGDYEGRELPEDAVLARWGGRTVVLPYLSGRSTTRIIEEATSRAAG